MLMYITGIVPILLNIILNEQQNQKQSPREQIQDKTMPRPHLLANVTSETETANPRHRPTESGEPILLPLPIKTQLFPDTQFFVFRKPGDAKHKHAQSETGIVFSLTTASLGQLFFMLTRRTDTTINIACHTENKKIADRLTEHAEELKQRVRELGFEQITFHCAILDQKARKLQTEFASPALLDRKV